jgi:hypothetical protein
MMPATALRLGNLVATADQPEHPDFVLMLEPCLVHLLQETLFREEHDIVGVPIDAATLHRYGIPHREWFPVGKRRVYLSVIHPRGLTQLHIGPQLHQVRWMHEIQNLIFDVTGEHLITHPHIHQPFQKTGDAGTQRAD